MVLSEPACNARVRDLHDDDDDDNKRIAYCDFWLIRSKISKETTGIRFILRCNISIFA